MNILEKLRLKMEINAAELGPTQQQVSIVQQAPVQSSELLRNLFKNPPKAEELASIGLPSSMALTLQEKVNKKKREANPHGYHEIDRILKLPVTLPMSPEEVEAYSFYNSLAKAFQGDEDNEPFRFYPTQAEALLAYDLFDGAFCPITVGDGKTLLCICIASKAFDKGKKKILYCMPSGTYGQLVIRDIPLARTWVPVTVPFTCMGHTTREKRLDQARSKRPGCYLLPYSCLSTEDSSELLDLIQPETIILDEAHEVSSMKAARTRRLRAYIEAQKELGNEVELIPLSGTITDKQIRDYHWLIDQSLKNNSPLPHSPGMVAEWGAFIDAKAEYTGSNAGPITHLIDWVRKNFPKKRLATDIAGFREAYMIRLNTAPGVVNSPGGSLKCSLTISNKKAEVDEVNDPTWTKLNELMDQITDDFLTPTGDQIEHAIHTFKWLYELSAGFYNKLVWPVADKFASTKKITTAQAAEMIERAKDHHDLHQIFSKKLREWLKDNFRPGIDTPLLVRSNMAQRGQADVGRDLYAAWMDMKAAEFEGMPTRDSIPVRVCDYKIRAAVAWARSLHKGQGGIIWAWNKELVDWMAEEFEKAGLDPFIAKAGKEANVAFVKDREKLKSRIILASMAHAQGKQLEFLQHQLAIQWPRSARRAEQLLGRLHRKGQKADAVVMNTLNTTMFDHLNGAACLNDGLYIHQTTGNRQRIIYAGYNPLPLVFPPQVLRERGLEPKILNAKQQTLMAKLFGQTKDAA